MHQNVSANSAQLDEDGHSEGFGVQTAPFAASHDDQRCLCGSSEDVQEEQQDSETWQNLSMIYV